MLRSSCNEADADRNGMMAVIVSLLKGLQFAATG